MSKPLFLIVTPSFNQSQFIGQTIDSIIGQQGNFDIAYVVMDGGSTDKTKEILKDYSNVILSESRRWRGEDDKGQGNDDNNHQPSTINHFFFESKKDKGQTDAINKGIRYIEDHLNVILEERSDDRISKKDQKDPIASLPSISAGRQDDMTSKASGIRHQASDIIFAYINSDDYYFPKTFEKVAKLFEKNPDKQWLVGDAVIINQNGNEIQSWVRIYKQILRQIYRIVPSLLFILNPIPQPSTFIRWSAVSKIGDFDQNLRYVMDYQYWLRLQKKFGLPIFLNKPLSCFRIHGLSKGGSQFDKQFAEQYGVAQKYSKNSLVLLLHQAHNWVTTSMYRIMK